MVPFLPLLDISFPLFKEGVNENKFKKTEPWIKSSQNIDMYVSMLMNGYEPCLNDKV